MIHEKNKIYQFIWKNKRETLITKHETLQNLIYEIQESCKSKYYEYILCSKAITPEILLIVIKNYGKSIIHDNKFYRFE